MVLSGIKRSWRIIRLGDPAAGADWSLEPGGQRWWRVTSFVATLVTSAVVANRRVRFEARSGERTWLRAPTAADQAATLTVVYTGHTACTARGIVDGTQVVELPSRGVLVRPGDTFRPVTAAIDVADRWSAVSIMCEEVVSGLPFFGDEGFPFTPTELEAYYDSPNPYHP